MEPNQQQPQDSYQSQVPVPAETPQPIQPTLPTPPPASPKPPTLVIAIVAVIVVIAIAAAALMFMPFKVKKASTPNSGDNTTKTQSSAIDKTTRRNDLSRIVAYANEYMANNNGKVPTAAELSAYLNQTAESLVDPTSEKAYVIQSGAPLATNQVQYSTNATCNADGTMLAQGTSSRQIAVLGMHGPDDFSCTSS